MVGAAAPAPTSAAPREAPLFQIVGAADRQTGLTVRVAARARGAGRIQLVGRLANARTEAVLCRSTVRVRRAGSLILECRIDEATLRRVVGDRTSGILPLVVTTTFTPSRGGAAVKDSVKVKMQGAATRPSRVTG